MVRVYYNDVNAGIKYQCQGQADRSIKNHEHDTEMFKKLLEIAEHHHPDNEVEMAKIVRAGFLNLLMKQEESQTILLNSLVATVEYQLQESNLERLTATTLWRFVEYREVQERHTSLLHFKLSEEVVVWHRRMRKPTTAVSANQVIVVDKEPNEIYVHALSFIICVFAVIYDYHQTTAHLV
jgi:hypothetical protein